LAHVLQPRSGRESGGLAIAVALASRQRRLGHPCLLLEEWADKALGRELHAPPGTRRVLPQGCPPLEAWTEELRASGVVACLPGEAHLYPLVLEDGRLYLQRMYIAEKRVAQALLTRLRPQDPPRGFTELLERVAPLATTDPEQRQAVEAVFRRGVHVLTGGPGTGKTSTVGRMLALALAVQPGLRIRLAAPTGKAAARLQEALGATLAWLPADLRPAVAKLPRATTLHRLLHEQPPVDWLVVDEASMVDLGLMDRVLTFLPDAARLLLVGDADQLASVDAGAVLHQVVQGLEGRRGAAVDDGGGSSVTRLVRSRRFAADSGIGRLAVAVRQGDAQQVMEVLRAPGPDLLWIPRNEQSAGSAFSGRLRAGLSAFIQAERPEEALAALEHFRVICGPRSGPVGVDAINRWCRRCFVDTGLGAFSPLLVRVNDHVLGLANGDAGVRARGPEGGADCHFQPGGAQVSHLSEAQLPPHDEAWAITVHQSQGSEADEVLLVLPEEGSPLLCRELLYTGLTRARRHLVVVGSEAALRQAVSTATNRTGGLAHALLERPPVEEKEVAR